MKTADKDVYCLRLKGIFLLTQLTSLYNTSLQNCFLKCIWKFYCSSRQIEKCPRALTEMEVVHFYQSMTWVVLLYCILWTTCIVVSETENCKLFPQSQSIRNSLLGFGSWGIGISQMMNFQVFLITFPFTRRPISWHFLFDIREVPQKRKSSISSDSAEHSLGTHISFHQVSSPLFFIQQKTLKETLCCSFKVAEKVEEVNFFSGYIRHHHRLS